MITSDDIGKQCFLRFKHTGGHTWENIGARIFAVAVENGITFRVTIQFKGGELRTAKAEDVRVLEPHRVP